MTVLREKDIAVSLLREKDIPLITVPEVYTPSINNPGIFDKAPLQSTDEIVEGKAVNTS